MAKTAIIYTRVSTHDQAETGYSLDDQEARLRKFCKDKNIEIVRHFQEDVSAKTFNRPEFQKLVAYVEGDRGAVDLLVVARWDRFSRNLEESLKMISRLEDLGVTVKPIEADVDTSVPQNLMLYYMNLMMPEIDNKVRSLNTKRGMREAKRGGRWVSKPPKGYDLRRDASNKPILVPNAEAHLVVKSYEEFAKGIYSVAELHRKMVDEGLICSLNQFHRLLRYPVYIGFIELEAWQDEEAEVIRGLHEAIISNDLYDRVQMLLYQSKKDTSKKTTIRAEYPLKGHLTCRLCGKSLTASASKGRTKHYRYYHCRGGCKERFSAGEANRVFADYLRSFTVRPEVAELYREVMNDIFKEQQGDQEKELTKLDRQLKTVDTKLLKIDQKHYVDEDMDQEAYGRLRRDCEAERGNLERRVEELGHRDSNFLKYLDFGLSLLTDLDYYYEEVPVEVKKKITGSIFPDGLVFDEGKCRTAPQNEFVSLMCNKIDHLQTPQKSASSKTEDAPHLVARAGFEPALPA
jgi:site-specific DNA recombinase